MIKSELVECVMRSYPGLYQRDAEFAVDAVLDAITDALAKGNRVEIRGFGAFWAKERRSRVGRNPGTGDRVPVAAKRVPRFKASREIHEALNNDTLSSRKRTPASRLFLSRQARRGAEAGGRASVSPSRSP
jgi:integration host factor subunit beta